MIRDHLSTSPRTKRQLAELSGWTQRDVELAIQQARLEGLPVCSNSGGYWLSDDPAEVERCVEALRRRLVSQYLTLRRLRETGRRMRDRDLEQQELPWSVAA